MPAAPVALYGVRLPTFSSANPPPSAGAGLLIGLIAAACIAAVAGALAQRIVDGLAAQTRVRTLRALGAAAAAIVLAGLVLAAVRTGGPIALVDRAWNQLTGNGQVSNATGNRFFTLLVEPALPLVERGLARVHAAADRGLRGGTFNLIDQLSRPDTTVAREAHSSGLQVLSGLGILGGIPALAALAGSAVACFEGWRRLAGEERVAAAALCGAVAGLAFHAQLDWDWTFAAITLVGYPIPGILSTAGRGTTRARSLERWMAGAALAAAGGAGDRVRVAVALAARDDARGPLLAAGRNDPALVESDLAISLDPLSTGALLDRATIQQLLGRPADAAADVRRALKLEPANADTWLQAAALQHDYWHDPGERVRAHVPRTRSRRTRSRRLRRSPSTAPPRRRRADQVPTMTSSRAPERLRAGPSNGVTYRTGPRRRASARAAGPRPAAYSIDIGRSRRPALPTTGTG